MSYAPTACQEVLVEDWIGEPGARCPHPINGGNGMLILTRREGEVVVITTPEGRRIEVMVTGRHYGNIRLGFTAEAGIQINRLEIQEEIDRAKKEE